MQFISTPHKLAYSIKEACEVSSLGKTTLYAHIAAGRLQAVKVGGRTLIPAASLLALLEGNSALANGGQR
ncbi:MAG: hypothetical protein RL764_538 [Pseudomonadota bacterium]|jgi:excisionase family DNA binding protein